MTRRAADPNIALCPPVGFGVLLRLKLRILRNRLIQLATESPVKFGVGVMFLAGIWMALYGLFFSIFHFIQSRWALESVVAQPLIFEVLFAVLTIMLAFSNGIIVYGSLFRQPEATWLMATPLPPGHVVRIRHFEGLFFASWSLVVLGVPLTLAFARSAGAPWYFHAVFLAFFIAFVPLPCALGTLVAGGIALWFPRSARRALFCLSVALFGGVCLWVGSLWYTVQRDEYLWLKRFFTHAAVVRSAALPSTWASRGISATANADMIEAGFYLSVLISNAMFGTWLAVRLVARSLGAAFDRAQGAMVRRVSATRSLSAVVSRAVFAFFPRRLRLLAAKDLRTFLRDALQWSQMAILLGLLVLYVINLPRLTPQLNSPRWLMLVSFLNLSTVAFILATFTGRFVFPLVSLELQQLWLVGMWPLSRRHLLLGKLCFALMITLLSALSVILLSAAMLRLPVVWALANAIMIAAICTGLCGLAVGLGARFPELTTRNSAKIAGGLGGTINLVCSLVFVCGVLLAAGFAHYHAAQTHVDRLDRIGVLLLSSAALVSLVVAAVAIRMGARHAESLEV